MVRLDERYEGLRALARSLIVLNIDDYRTLLRSMAIHSGLERLELMNQIADETIKDYDNLKEWRDIVGETT